MGQVIPRQHPAVVLKSHYKALRALLAAALIAIAALAAAVVILANDEDNTKASVQPAVAHVQSIPQGTRFDGGPDEGTRGPQTNAQSASPLSGYEASDEDSSEPATPPVIPMGPGGR